MGDLAHGPLQGTKAVLFVDPRVEGWMSLTAGVDPTTRVVLVDTEREAIEQMRGALRHDRDLSAIHVLAHGEAGRIQIGRSGMDAAGIDKHARELAAIARRARRSGPRPLRWRRSPSRPGAGGR